MDIMFLGNLLIFAIAGYFIKKREINLGKKEWCIVFVWLSVTMLLFMKITGILDSGYHLIDDHEVYEIKADFLQFGFWGTMIKWLKADLNIRFRFSYFIFRILECYFLGDRFKLWHITQSMISALGVFTAYFFARRMQTPPWLSYLFSMVIFLGGGQSAVLWRLGPQEGMGVLLLMLTLISLTYYAENKKIFGVSVILTFFLAGIKESFLILLPLLPLLLLIIEMRREGDFDLLKCRNRIRDKWLYWVVTYAIFAVDMCIVIFRVGTNEIGYAGIDSAYGVKEYFKGILGICLGSFRVYILISGVGILFLLACLLTLKRKVFTKDISAEILVSVLAFGYIVASQFVLYAKSGMDERYLIPATVGFSIFWIIDINSIVKKLSVPFFCHSIFMVFLTLALIVGGKESESACLYAMDGKNTTEMMEQIARYEDLNPDIIISLGYEMDFSVSVYLQEKYGIKTVYNVNYSGNDGSVVQDGWRKDPEEREGIEFDKAHMYLGYGEKIESDMKNYGLNIEDFSAYKYGKYVLYVSKIFDDR